MRRLQAVAAVLIGLSATASAAPFTYDFTIPSYTANNDQALFGSAMNLAITVDNGGATGVGQSYTFSNIDSVNASAVGGSFLYDFSATNPMTIISNNLTFITTNSLGVPTLRLGVQGNATGYWATAVYNQNYQSTSISFGQEPNILGATYPFYVGAPAPSPPNQVEATYYPVNQNTGILPSINILGSTASTSLPQNNSGTLTIPTGQTLINNSGTTANNTGTINNNGTIHNNGKIITYSGLFNDQGTVNGTGTFTQSSGTTLVNGTMTQSQVTINGGRLMGTGIIYANIQIDPTAGLVLGGSLTSAGTLTINGKLTEGQNGIIQSLIFGSGTNGLINVNGPMSASGLLDIAFGEGVSRSTLQAGQTYDLINFTTLSGAFSGVNWGSLDSNGVFTRTGSFSTLSGNELQYFLSGQGLYLNLFYNSSNCSDSYTSCLSLQIASASPINNPSVPEPGELGMMGLGLGFLCWFARCARQKRDEEMDRPSGQTDLLPGRACPKRAHVADQYSGQASRNLRHPDPGILDALTQAKNNQIMPGLEP